MNALRLAMVGFAGLVSLAGPAAAQSVVDEYCTSITENDKSASDGFELTDAGSILRQDRANYHKFGYRDRGDQGDRTFGSANARALIPAMLDRGDTDASVLRQIVRGTPSVCVWIFPDHIYVYEN
ncbi:hypothetical protein [Jiella pacifica]|uniref:Uncharacterized protein n=1 Tax=Jiella pacifica TaxID=2696469 RepID=A0A6N9T448_9HYPH|nr:hypothetical protein [Jiella pacifica]NDW06147.1 hypothetical protein [Jiella pacifica]